MGSAEMWSTRFICSLLASWSCAFFILFIANTATYVQGVRLADLLSGSGAAAQTSRNLTLNLQRVVVLVEDVTFHVPASTQLTVAGQGPESGLDLRAFGSSASPAFSLPGGKAVSSLASSALPGYKCLEACHHRPAYAMR